MRNRNRILELLMLSTTNVQPLPGVERNAFRNSPKLATKLT